MKFDIPEIRRDVCLAQYDGAFPSEAVVKVWVNPPRGLLIEWDELMKTDTAAPDVDIKVVHAKQNEILAKLWGWPVDDVIAFEKDCLDRDPQLFRWLIVQTFMVISLHRANLKKN